MRSFLFFFTSPKCFQDSLFWRNISCGELSSLMKKKLKKINNPIDKKGSSLTQALQSAAKFAVSEINSNGSFPYINLTCKNVSSENDAISSCIELFQQHNVSAICGEIILIYINFSSFVILCKKGPPTSGEAIGKLN